MRDERLLDRLQGVLARITDVPVEHAVTHYHFAERAQCAALLGRELGADEDEQVLLAEGESDAAVSVYIDAAVLERLAARDPMQQLNEGNLADFCTALEGVSHFHYLVWCIGQRRQLSLLELELQAEVDKYAVAAYLLRQQGRRDLPRGLRRRLFLDIGFVAGLSQELRQRYVEANRRAARFCEQLEQRFLQSRSFRPDAWLRAVREFYRMPHHEKLRRALNPAS